MKLSEYGITGPWQMMVCDGCGKRRSCCVFRQSQGYDDYEEFGFCVPCCVKDIRDMERAQREDYEMQVAADVADRLERGEL